MAAVDPTPGTTGTARERAAAAGGAGGRRRAPFPTEAIVFAATVVAVLIAAAVADNLDATLAWPLVTFLAVAYILSRGLVKRGVGADDGL
ncbi:MAG TPA: hypothetical protein VGW75_03140 [Solirubrobacteraceae bacterium]|nr:hypothetical protein [Solirubrobacteraceae bacterium]